MKPNNILELIKARLSSPPPQADAGMGILRDAVQVLPKGHVWGVRDYHTTLERRAIAGATISWGYVSMTVAAAVMATAGLLLNNVAAIIGAMCVAPFMPPSRAVCIGALFRVHSSPEQDSLLPATACRSAIRELTTLGVVCGPVSCPGSSWSSQPDTSARSGAPVCCWSIP